MPFPSIAFAGGRRFIHPRLDGGGEQAVLAMIVGGKNNVMPSQAKLMTPEQIHVLGAYVWGLSQTTRVAAQ